MREIRTHGSMSGKWKRSMVRLVRHRQPKGPATDRPHLNHRATLLDSTLRARTDTRRSFPQKKRPVKPTIAGNLSANQLVYSSLERGTNACRCQSTRTVNLFYFCSSCRCARLRRWSDCGVRSLISLNAVTRRPPPPIVADIFCQTSYNHRTVSDDPWRPYSASYTWFAGRRGYQARQPPIHPR